jgi:biopolymer transport protein ExbD
MRFKRNLKILTGPSYVVPPLIDVVFLLLIFIMLGSSLVFQSGITVRLPEVQQQFSGAADKLVITHTKERLLFFNDQKVKDWDDLDRRLQQVAVGQAERSRRPVIILKADRDIPYKNIVRIIALARNHDLEVFMVTKTAGG